MELNDHVANEDEGLDQFDDDGDDSSYDEDSGDLPDDEDDAPGDVLPDGSVVEHFDDDEDGPSLGARHEDELKKPVNQLLSAYARLGLSKHAVKRPLSATSDAWLRETWQSVTEGLSANPSRPEAASWRRDVQYLEAEAVRRGLDLYMPVGEVDVEDKARASVAAISESKLPEGELVRVSILDILESPKNPRKNFDQAKLRELAASLEAHGVLTPPLVRPHPTLLGKFELAAGHRRIRALRTIVGYVGEVGVVVREMTDVQLLEVLTIENLQRDDVHPLEEAQGYQDLIKEAAYTAARIAERVGKSEKYVYDRIKLLQLIPEARKLFLAGRFESGHAILLARLKPEDQKRAIDPDNAGGEYRTRGLWQDELPLLSPDEEIATSTKRDPYEDLKAVSVREFQGWIDQHVRIDLRRDRDALLFPEMTEVLADAQSMNLKVIPITYDHVLPRDARSDEKTYGPKSWERADGKHGSKTCAFKLPGYVVAGPGRGEAFDVCTAKEKCKIHWPEQFKRAQERKKLAKKVAAGEAKKPSKSAEEKAERERKAQEAQLAKEQAEREAREAERKRFTAALPKILDRFADVMAKASTAPSGALAAEIKGCMQEGMAWDAQRKAFKAAETHMGKGKTAEDLVRLLAFASIVEDVCGHHGEYQRTAFTTHCKQFGFDVKKALDEISPPAPKAKPAKPAAISNAIHGVTWAHVPGADAAVRAGVRVSIEHHPRPEAR